MTPLRMALLALAMILANGPQSATAQGLRVGAASVADAAMLGVCGPSNARSLGVEDTDLCQRLAAVLAERPRLSRRPTPAWSGAYDSLLADALDATRRDSEPVAAHAILHDLIAIALEPGLLRWRQVDLASIHRALAALHPRQAHNLRTRRGCVALAVTVRDFPTARDCAHSAFDAGQDATWHLLRLAWLETKRGAPTVVDSLVRLAVASARARDDHAELIAHVNAALDSRAGESEARADRVQRFRDVMGAGFAEPGHEALPVELVSLIAGWLEISEFWGGVFHGCPNIFRPGQRVLVACDREALPFERRNLPEPAATQLPIAEYWDPGSGEERVAIVGLPVDRVGATGVLRFWSTTSSGVGRFSEVAVDRVQSSAAGRVVAAAVPRGVRSWFFDAGDLPSGEHRLIGVDDADVGRARTECVSDLLLVPSDDPDTGLGTGWVGKVPFTNVLRRHQPALLGVQYRHGDATQHASVTGRVTITALDGRQRDVSMSVEGRPNGAHGELSIGLDLSRLRAGRYRAMVSVPVPGCSGEQRAMREFRVVEE